MDRIDTVGATAESQFTVGNPIAGVPATVLGDVYLNDVQEELLAVIESAGLTPTRGVQTQILEAVLALVANEINTALGREVDVVAPSDLALAEPFMVEDLFGLAKTAILSGQIVTMDDVELPESEALSAWEAISGRQEGIMRSRGSN